MKNIIESFFWGIIAALGALIVELVTFIVFSFYSNSTVSLSFFQLFTIPKFIIAGALIEELLKYTIISKRIEMFSVGRSFLINSFLVGFGFFATEIGLAKIAGTLPPIHSIAEIAILHIGTAGLIGYVLAIRNPKKISTLLFAVFPALLFHGAYNLLILNRTFIYNYAIFALIGFLALISIVNLLRINGRQALR